MGRSVLLVRRAIVEAPVYDAFVDAVREKVATIKVGDPVENAAMGPVINEVALKRVLGYIEQGKTEGRLINGGKHIKTDDGGYYIEPTVFADVAPDARIAQEEIFGPVLAIIKADSYQHALAIANNTEYGLTGAVYTRDRQKLHKAKLHFHVGNLYFNRKCTGAMVGAHPFGGFNMSGTDSKAGGADYLYLFTQAKSVAERLG